MSVRDRIVLLILAAAGVMAAAWFLAVAPARQKADAADQRLVAAQLLRSSATAQQNVAQRAQLRFAANVADVKLLGRAVPADAGVSALLKQLQATARARHVDFRGITASTTAGTAAGASAPPSAGTAVPAVSATLPSLSFAFTFSGSFLSLERFLDAVNHYTTVNGTVMHVHGRLLSIQSVTLASPQSSTKGSSSSAMEATVSVVAYMLGSGQSVADILSKLSPELTPAARNVTPSSVASPSAILVKP